MNDVLTRARRVRFAELVVVGCVWLFASGCKQSASPPPTVSLPPPPSVVPVTTTPVAGTASTAVVATATPAGVPPPAVANVLRPEPIKGVKEYGAKRGSYQLDAGDAKGIAEAVENMNWHVDNYWSQFNRGPSSIDELKKWDYPMYLKGWPIPPPGQKWALSGNAAQVRLEKEK